MHSRTLMFVVCFAVFLTETGTTGSQKEKPTLEQAYRQWHTGLAAKDKKDREKALRAMLPNEKDVQLLFPKHAAKLWPLMEKGNQILVENVDQIAKELTRGGELTGVRVFDMRKEKKIPAGYKRLFEIIPKDVPVFEVEASRGDGSAGRSLSYVYLHNRWVWVQELDEYPRALEKLK